MVYRHGASYTIRPVDFHSNDGNPTAFTVNTPQSSAINPRRVGVNALGTYWGGMGEQIDTRSGNLNYTLPLLSAQGRGGWAVPFALSYNSQMWRKDPWWGLELRQRRWLWVWLALPSRLLLLHTGETSSVFITTSSRILLAQNTGWR
jgi:hypothetical protein